MVMIKRATNTIIIWVMTRPIWTTSNRMAISNSSLMNMGTRHLPKMDMMKKILKILMVIQETSMEVPTRRTIGNKALLQLERIARSTHRLAFRLGQLLRETLCFSAQNRAIHMKNYSVIFNNINNIRELIQALRKWTRSQVNSNFL